MNPTLPTLARLLLASACLLGASLVVMADELPQNTNQIESLTVEEAKRLVAEFKGNALSLDGITTLDTATAKALAEFKGRWLVLNGLTTLDAATTKSLADYKGAVLFLNGLTVLDVDTAKALVEFKGQGLCLDGLATLDAATAKALAEFKGQMLNLEGLTTLDSDTARALSDYKGEVLYLDGLTTLDTETAEALGGGKGAIWLTGLQRASFGAVWALRYKANVSMPNHWYLLRYQIAALVGTVVFVVLAGVVVWYSRRHRDAAVN